MLTRIISMKAMASITVILALFAAVASGQNEDDDLQGHMYEGVYGYLNEGHVRIFGGFGASFRVATPPVKKVSNIPFDLRNVEPHGDDLYKATPGAIADDDSRAPWITDIELLRGGIEFDLSEDFVLQLYGNGSWNYGHWFNLGGEENKRNYTNAPGTDKRGWGAALTIYEVTYERWIPGVGLEMQFADLEADEDDNHTHFCLGYQYRWYDLQITGGYDRYNRTDHEHHESLGRIGEQSIYFGWGRREKNGVSFFKFGVVFHDYESRDSYRHVEVGENDIGYFISLGGMYQF